MKNVLASRSLGSVATVIIEESGVRELVDQGLSFEQIKAMMMEKAGLTQS